MEAEEELALDIEQAREQHPDCVIVPVVYEAPLLPEWPNGFRFLLAVPRAKVRSSDPEKLPAWLALFRQFGAERITIRPKEGTDARIDAAIRAVYQSAPTRGAVNRLADSILRPRWWVSHRAAELGLVVPRFKELAWTDEETEFLAANAHRDVHSLSTMFRRRGWKRSPTAIAVKRKRLHLSTLDPEHFTAHELAVLMGIDAKCVTRWIEREGLAAVRRGTKRVAAQGGDMWSIKRKALRRWIATHAQQVDLRKVDRFWFIDLAFGGNG